MLKDTTYREKGKVPVNIQLADGSLLDGFVFCTRGERVSDLLNDTRDFLPFETHTNDIMMLRKAVIATILPHETQARKKTPTDPYKILGIDRSADRETAKHAYHQMVHLYHPDKLASLDLPEDMENYATDMLSRINSAYTLVMRQIEAEATKAGTDRAATAPGQSTA